MPSKSRTQRYCSFGDEWHRIDGQPCGTCWEWECPVCRYWAPVSSPRCRVCRAPMTFSRKQLAALSHQRGIVNCPKCGRKLRQSARDKRRMLGLKQSAQAPRAG